MLLVKGSKTQAEALREEYRGVLEGSLKLKLNMDKTRITHVNDCFIFLGHRIVRKRSRYGDMRVVSTRPTDKVRNFAKSLAALLSGNYSESKVDMVEILNRKLKGWAAFYQFVDFKAKVFCYIDQWCSGSWLTGWPANTVQISLP
ncbi:group II intron maturase-specific domain-containing protein [Aeromonas veronii]